MLYHFTRELPLLNMLMNDEISLTYAMGSSADLNINKDKPYFFSMQTTRNGGFGHSFNGGRLLPVKLVMDGEKLNHNFKGGPVDYWQHRGNDKRRVEMDEFEERLMSDKDSIQFSRYVKEIHFYLDKRKHFYDEKIETSIGAIRKKADDLGVPIYFYEDKTAYLNNAKDRTVEVEPSDVPDDYKWSDDGFGIWDLIFTIAGNNERSISRMAGHILDNGLVPVDDSDKFLHQVIRRWNEFKQRWNIVSPSPYYMKDLYRSLESTIHNSRSSTNPVVKYAFRMLNDNMRNLDVKNLKDWMEAKYGKLEYE